jgi:hypothetical protein
MFSVWEDSATEAFECEAAAICPPSDIMFDTENKLVKKRNRRKIEKTLFRMLLSPRVLVGVIYNYSFWNHLL